MPQTSYNSADLAKLARAQGQDISFSTQKPQLSALTSGDLVLSHTQSKALFHFSDVSELENITVSCQRCSELALGVLLEGELNFSLDDKRFTLSVKPDSPPKCFLINVLQSTTWKRQLVKNNRIKKVLVCVSHSWLQSRFKGHTDLDNFVHKLQLQHAIFKSLEIDHQSNTKLQRLLNSRKKGLSEFELDGLTMNLVLLLLKSMKKHTFFRNDFFSEAVVASPAGLRIRQFLDEQILQNKPDVKLKLNEMAKNLGMSVSTAQRQFKTDFKQTIMDYLRGRRLDMARVLLLDNMSIGEASYLAGYNHTSNFSLAFKKRFGVSPGDFMKNNL